jgi:hypothetical protein
VAKTQTPPQQETNDEDLLASVDAKVDAKMENVNDRITAVIERFEAYIHEKAVVT